MIQLVSYLGRNIQVESEDYHMELVLTFLLRDPRLHFTNYSSSSAFTKYGGQGSQDGK